MVGDVVVTTVLRYSNLQLAAVIGFTPKKIRVQSINGDPELKDRDQVVKVDPKIYFYRLLKKKAE